MDAQDFTMPSPKRQRTQSPKPALEAKPEDTTHNKPLLTQITTSEELEMKPMGNIAEENAMIPGLGIGLPDEEPGLPFIEAQLLPTQSNGFLDALMQHVESMSRPENEETLSEVVPQAVEPVPIDGEHVAEFDGEVIIKSMDTQPEQHFAPSILPAAPEPKPTTRNEQLQQATEAAGAAGTVSEPALEDKVNSNGAPVEQEQSGTELQPGTGADISAGGKDTNQDQVMTGIQQGTGRDIPTAGRTTSQDQGMTEVPQRTGVDLTVVGKSVSQDQVMNELRKAPGADVMAVGKPTSQDETMSEVQYQIAEPVTAEGGEWEVDSSPYVSSDSDDSSDTTSDDSDDADGDYAMLDPEEQARILMAGDGGSDDEGEKKGKTDGGHLRTANEKIEEVIPKPNIVVTDEMKIEELGAVEVIVEKTVLVRAKVSGEYQVLESNSLLCLQNRSVVGVVAEPVGRVEQPMYTIRFTNDGAIKEAGLSERGTKVFYVPQYSTFVFTQPLRAVKGSDASNFHDEEVGDEEMEFSDDEQEAEHKRQMKMKRQGRRDEQGGGEEGVVEGGPTTNEVGLQDHRAPSSDVGSVHGNAGSEISYDDAADGNDEGYTPLTRPANLSEMMAGVQRQPLEGSHHAGGLSDRGDPDIGRGRGRGRGRGDRDRRGGRGGRGGGGSQPSWATYQNTSAQQSNGYTQHQPQSMPPPPQFPYQYQQQQPHQPRLAPQAYAFSPSPISPLTSSPFNFSFQQQAQQWPGAPPYQQHYGQIPQANSQYDTQQFTPGQQPGQSSTHGWNPNQVGAAYAAAQLEQFRRNQQGQ